MAPSVPREESVTKRTQFSAANTEAPDIRGLSEYQRQRAMMIEILSDGLPGTRKDPAQETPGRVQTLLHKRTRLTGLLYKTGDQEKPLHVSPKFLFRPSVMLRFMPAHRPRRGAADPPSYPHERLPSPARR